jgi:hypothetical protein
MLEAIYNIAAHGDMFSTINNMESDKRSIKFYACDIPENVELYTYTELGLRLACTFTAADFICRPKRKLQNNNKLLTVNEPIYKFERPSKFPNLFLHPDLDNYKQFYSGITYCNKEKPNEDKSEVIYNIDAKKSDDCNCTTIAILKDKQKTQEENNPYNCDKKYSTYYKKLLKENRQRCGPILLDDAIKLILDHSEYIHSDKEVTIKIYLHCCLTHSNLSCKVHDYLYAALINKTDKQVANFNLDRFGSGFVEKLLTSTNTVDNIEDFKGISIVQDEKIIKFLFNTTLITVTINNIDVSESNVKKNLAEYKHILKFKLEKLLVFYIEGYKETKFPRDINLLLDSLILLTTPSTIKGPDGDKTNGNKIDEGTIKLGDQLNTLLDPLGTESYGTDYKNIPDLMTFPELDLINLNEQHPHVLPNVPMQHPMVLPKFPEQHSIGLHGLPSLPVLPVLPVNGGRHKHKLRHTYKKTLRKKYKKPKKTKHIKNFTKKHKSKKNRKY